MTTRLRSFWQNLRGPSRRAPQRPEADAPAPEPSRPGPLSALSRDPQSPDRGRVTLALRSRASAGEGPESDQGLRQPAASPFASFDIAPNDPLVAYFQSMPGAVEVDRLQLESPALDALKVAGVKMVMPLVSQGELVGLLNLGPRLSEQDYSADDRTLLNNLAGQAAPAVRVAQLVRQQQMEAQARERLEQEMRVARLIQQTLLPQELPTPAGWRVAAYYQPARAVGGDFYDFIYLADGRLALVVGDVTDKGVPAALVMATTRSILRSAAEQFHSPGEVLERANNLLCPDIPRNMFVTCLYAILDTASGRLLFANAGHDLPYRHGAGGVDELRATGMPLGLMPGMTYEEKEIALAPGDRLLFYSDGLVEAHSPTGEMFGFPRLRELVGIAPHASRDGGQRQNALVEYLLAQLADFTGPGWEQEDDVTLVILERASASAVANATGQADRRSLAEFTLSSEPGNERLAMLQVADVVGALGLEPARLERLKTAVAEATMNAMEHGNQYRPDLPVAIEVSASPADILVRITDHGGGRLSPEREAPDLDAKLAGLQSPRGWGLFLIKNMVDEMRISGDEVHHTVELIMRLPGSPETDEGENDGNPAV